jgi:hypothetical protein
VSAIVILLVALGAIFVLVGSGGVSTDVSLPESVVSSTPEPSVTPTIVPSADVWTLDETQQQKTWTYTDDQGVTARIVSASYPMEELAAGFQVEPPAEDSALPTLDTLQKIREALTAQLGITPDSSITFSEPAIQLIGGVPVALMRLKIPAGSSASIPAGFDYGLALIDQGDNQVNFASYDREAEPSDEVFGLFEAWLEAHATELATPEEPEAIGTEEAISVAPAERWAEVADGQYAYTGGGIYAQFIYSVMTLEEFVAQTALEVPAADSETPLLDILAQIRGTLEEQVASQGLTISEEQVQGPEMSEINGVPAGFLRVNIPSTPGDESTAIPGLDLALYLIDLGDGRVNALQYVLRGDVNEDVFNDFLAWVEVNKEMLTNPPVEVPAATEEATAESGE